MEPTRRNDAQEETPRATGSSKQTATAEEEMQDFFQQNYGKIQQMFNQFSSNKRNSKEKARRTLEFPSSPQHDRSRSITPGGDDRPYVHTSWRGRGAQGSPFVNSIAKYTPPGDFRIPQNIRLYDGTTDPDDHLNTYNNTMNIFALPMPMWCKVFPATLTDKARLWFEKLPPESIASYADLENKFRSHFSQLKKFQTTKAEFMDIHQGENESLRAYVERFNSESLKVSDRSEDFLIHACIHGLRHGRLYRDLIADPPQTMENLLKKINDFARADEADRRKREDG